jgi:hypothetical protein|tara:strand:+ start:489 stop:1160 length:672 start_codon:yes stop_codon:yes gene_type:complete
MTLDLNQNNFKFVFLGQSVFKYEVPLDIYNIINHIYESKYLQLPKANPQLVGKIEKEHSLFFDGPDNNKMIKHNHLPKDVLMWFESKFKHYLDWNKIKEYKTHLNSIWVNTMFEHEYNPVHVHQGGLFTGLSSVMILKLPESYGVEYSASHQPQNGRLQILGSSNGYFSNVDYQPNIKERDFYVFPYDMRHCVYPFNGPGYRRTLAANMDVQYDPIKNRGVSD